MGFFITNEFKEEETGFSQTNFYVGIRGLPLTWAKNMEGTKIYWIDTRYFIKKAKAERGVVGPEIPVRVNLTTEQATDSNAAALGVIVYDAIKALPMFSGCTFEDEL